MSEEDVVISVQDSWWTRFLDHGPLYLGSYLLFVLAVIIAITLIRRKKPLPWLLLASLFPLIAAMFAGHVRTITYFGYMTLPDFEFTKKEFYPEIYFLWVACLTSAALATASYYRSRSRAPAANS